MKPVSEMTAVTANLGLSETQEGCGTNRAPDQSKHTALEMAVHSTSTHTPSEDIIARAQAFHEFLNGQGYGSDRYEALSDARSSLERDAPTQEIIARANAFLTFFTSGS